MAGRVLVTGANSGIGLATVIELAGRGFEVFGGVRSAAKARRVREAAEEAGVSASTVILDVTDAAACRHAVERVRPWALVNNAGVGAVGAVEDVDDETVRNTLETMLVGPARLARLCLPHMRAAGGGRIVMLSSIYGIATTPLSGWYQASKHGLEALSDALRVEVAGAGVKVILVEPGGFDTGIWDSADAHMERHRGSAFEDAYGRVKRSVGLAKPLMGDPSRVAKVVAKALTSRRPSPRYLVGLDARALAVYERVAPTRVKDRVARTILGI